MERETNTVVLTTQELLKLINHDHAFKSSNWKEWLEDESQKRRHRILLIRWSVFTICVLFGGTLYAGQISLLNKETMTGLLGAIIGSGLSIFIKSMNIHKLDKN